MRRRAELPVERGRAPEGADDGIDEATRALVHAALLALSGQQREALDLAVRHDLDAEELGLVLSKTPHEASVLVEQARNDLDDAFAAVVVAATGRDDCPSVPALAGPPGQPLDAERCATLARHIAGCPICGLRVNRDHKHSDEYLNVAAFALKRWVGPGVPAAALSISVIYIPQYFRVVRNHTLAVREEAFVDAARAMGAPKRVIIVRYVAANVLQSVPVIFTVNAADAVLTLAALGFLGYGVPLRTAEWGFDIGNAISDVGTGAWWTSLFPGLAIVGLVTGLSLLGEGAVDIDAEGTITGIDNCSCRRMAASAAPFWWRCSGGMVTIDSVTIASGSATPGNTASLRVKGTNLVSDATVELGPGVTVSKLKVTTAGNLTFDAAIANDAAPGDRTLTITNPDCSFATSPKALTVAAIA